QEDIEPDIEHIQDVVEQALISSNFVKTARAYIAYRQQHKTLRDDKKTLVDVASSINEYLDRADWRVNANANQGYSLGGLILNVSGKVIANYWLSHVYAPEVGSAHRQGDLHIHDLDMLAGYCAGWSLRTLLREGLNGVEGRIEAGPPKHLSSAVGQMVNFLGTLQNEWAGAQAFSSFDTYLAPYIRLDSLGYGEVKQCIQELIYNLNVPSRWGTQTPFTNLTFDWVCPEDLRDQVPMMGDEEMPFTYGELQVEMDMINQAYIEVMTEGDAKGRVFTFPIPTYNMTEDFPWESENAKRLFDMTAKYGLPYFQNFLNSDLKPNMVRSMCCRLQLDLNELLKRGNGLFGSAEQTGSLGVVTINCARLGHVYKGDSKGLYEQLDKLLLMAKDSLEVKRKVVQKLMDNGLFPYTKRYLGTLRNHFSTIGVNGINEMIRNFSQDKEDITSTDGYPMAVEFLDHIRLRMIEFQEQTGHMFNLEATPAEGTTYRFAKEDMKRYPDILHAGTKDKPYYTNSSQLPVGYTADPFEALEKQDELQTKYTGGTVLHLYMGERISSGEACMKMVKRSLTNFRLPYITITPTFSICPTHGYLSGEHEYCPKCDEVLLANKKLKNQGDKNEKAKNIANQ
ncbi:MAG: ribonucleoside triphosphate reductase, partial [Candidatus Thioglobus sp.]|nr:ribonucleoside triphosphate reductase [Candidatus Thioglobus sp.]